MLLSLSSASLAALVASVHSATGRVDLGFGVSEWIAGFVRGPGRPERDSQRFDGSIRGR